MFIVLCLSVAVPAYILGGVNGAIIASKYFYRKDIRKYGSGNPGLTNFYRVFGKYGAVAVVLIDAAKTIVPVLLGGWLFNQYYGLTLFGRELAGLAAVLGHCYPVFYGFQGGKGVMAAGTVVLFVDWRIALVSWLSFLLITAVTRYVSLGAIIGVSLYPVTQAILGMGETWELILAILTAALLIFRHRENIVRLVSGTEPKFSFRRKTG